MASYSGFRPDLMTEIRASFAHVDSCPFQGPRVFLENAGGALTLKAVAETSARFAAIPDNQGRDNVASNALNAVISKAKADISRLLGASTGQIVMGESGTELLFRMIRTAVAAAPAEGCILGSTLEHPASRSAAQHWAARFGLPYVSVPHDDNTGTITAAAYAQYVTPSTAVATILHASPVTGIEVDVAEIAAVIRSIAPDCIIIVDGIQRAAHGSASIDSYDIDGYAVSPYKLFSRHGYGIAWISERLTALEHETLLNGPLLNWELGTRDAGAYATLSDVVTYIEWLGSKVSDDADPRARISAAGIAIHDHEAVLTSALIEGVGNLRGLSNIPGAMVLGGADNPHRAGLVSVAFEGIPSAEIVTRLNANGIRTHVRKGDHYSGNILNPLGLADCVRISFCHYNTLEEVAQLLTVLEEIIPS